MEAFESEPVRHQDDAKKPGMRHSKHIELIKPYVKSLKVIKENCENLEEGDFDELAKCIKLNKVRKNTRLFNAGDPSTEFIIVLRGQLGIIYPDSVLMELIKEGPESVVDRCELLTEDDAD